MNTEFDLFSTSLIFELGISCSFSFFLIYTCGLYAKPSIVIIRAQGISDLLFALLNVVLILYTEEGVCRCSYLVMEACKNLSIFLVVWIFATQNMQNGGLDERVTRVNNWLQRNNYLMLSILTFFALLFSYLGSRSTAAQEAAACSQNIWITTFQDFFLTNITLLFGIVAIVVILLSFNPLGRSYRWIWIMVLWLFDSITNLFDPSDFLITVKLILTRLIGLIIWLIYKKNTLPSSMRSSLASTEIQC